MASVAQRWQGRRQSDNIIDLRGQKPQLAVMLKWQQRENLFLEQSSIIIYSNGGLFVLNRSSVDLIITFENPNVNNNNISPQITSGQLDTTRQIINNLLPSYTVTVKIGPGDYDEELAEIAQNLINQR